MSGEKIILTAQYELACPWAQSTNKSFFSLIFFVAKICNFFLELPISTTKWPQGLQTFSTKLPRGMNKTHTENFRLPY